MVYQSDPFPGRSRHARIPVGVLQVAPTAHAAPLGARRRACLSFYLLAGLILVPWTGVVLSLEQLLPRKDMILDRFLQHAVIVTITGKSYRLKDRACGKCAKKHSRTGSK